MSAGLDPYLAYDPDYAEFVELVAATLGAAIDNAYRHSTELGEYRRISETLQGAMLQPVDDLPTVAARYLAAEGRLAVGGDWFDVIELDDGRRGLVVGDCVGHGLEAAAAMSQLRSAARAMLLEGRRPSEVLSGLDPLALSLPDAFCATAVCAVVDRGARSLTCARAGHLPPLLIHDGTADWLEEGGGPPLGLGSSDRSELTRRLEVGDLIALYSDGLVERRDEHIDVGLERLRAMVTELHGRPVQQLADELIGALVPQQHSDDVVLVLKQL
jgi:serine phosphatase RsbU (regulator of sigma subunit)